MLETKLGSTWAIGEFASMRINVRPPSEPESLKDFGEFNQLPERQKAPFLSQVRDLVKIVGLFIDGILARFLNSGFEASKHKGAYRQKNESGWSHLRVSSKKSRR